MRGPLLWLYTFALRVKLVTGLLVVLSVAPLFPTPCG